MAENIRIGKQLIPTILLHLWTVITSFIVYLSTTFSIGNFFYILAFTTSTNTFCSLLIEITTITFVLFRRIEWKCYFRRHPFLRRDLIKFLNGIWLMGKCENRIGINENERRNGIAMKDINGRKLVKEMDQNEHFQMLNTFWNK